MRIVPRQLRRYGMTGDVPYYGGRLTPNHIYALSHTTPEQAPPGPPPNDPMHAVQHLYDTGVLTQEEYDTLRARMQR